MRKPSIFSRDYEKYMKRRRKKIRISIAMGTLCIVCGTVYISYDFSNIASSIMKLGVRAERSDAVMDDNLSDQLEIEPLSEGIESNEAEDVNENKYDYEDLIFGNVAVTIMFKESNGETVIEDIIENNEISCIDISQDKSKALVLDNRQNIFVVDSEKNIIDLTYSQYTSTKGTTFKKDEVLDSYENYKWHDQAKFIDNNKIAYVTNVPYFGSGMDEYIAVVDINDNLHKTQWELRGKEIKIENLQEKGLELILDGNVIYMTANYDIIK